MSSIQYIIQTGLFCQDPDYLVWLPEDPLDDSTAWVVTSQKSHTDFLCPHCGEPMHVYGTYRTRLRTVPMQPNARRTVLFEGHRFRCPCCQETVTELNPYRCPGTRITKRAAVWIKSLLAQGLTIAGVQKITGIHWDTIRRVQETVMEETLEAYAAMHKKQQYKPRFLAVDEFAIHKGHTYATTVMDLESGFVLWVGKGRSIVNFQKFFEEVPSEQLSDVQAVAMDMNASYNTLVRRYLPQADIVYDRYHMQAQYGRDVLGVVRLEEARKHKTAADKLKQERSAASDSETAKTLRRQEAVERSKYRQLKQARWTLLTNQENLKPSRKDSLETIISEHEAVAICYAMKEEMIKLYAITDYEKAVEGWKRWFKAAKESEIPALIRFAKLKEKRIDGLANHAKCPINTGRLEGYNNKIKVAKRNAYGYKNDRYFFTLIRYLSLPTYDLESPKNT